MNVHASKLLLVAASLSAACRFGLSSDDGDHTAFPANCFAPSNLAATDWPIGGDADLVVDGVWVANTETGEILSYTDLSRSEEGTIVRVAGESVQQGIEFTVMSSPQLGSGVAVFSATSLTIPRESTFVGIGPRPLVLQLYSDVRIAGELSVEASILEDVRHAGAGGNLGGAKGSAGAGPSPGGGALGGGGNGGGYASPGGMGGSGPAPTPTVGTLELTPLFGGSGGGGGRENETVGGHGGGALQVSVCGRISVESTGVVDASGEGGLASAVNGGGGGSGGAILLEANEVEILGFVGSNGGGGGGELEFGRNGDARLVPALGGTPDAPYHGGFGSRLDGVAGGGGASGGCCPGGGGGGGAGRIRINTASGTEVYDSGISPSMVSGLATVGKLEE